MDERLYKVLDKKGCSCNDGNGKWFLPSDKQPGKWMPKITGLVPCKKGYHLCRESDLVNWIGLTIYEVEYQGDHLVCDDKIVVSQARLLRKLKTWNDQTARLFVCDCAERVLPIFEKQYPKDERPRRAIVVARLFVERKATKEELAAAGNAAGDAGAAAWAAGAAWAAVWSARAAGDAARAAAWAAGDAAWAAAWAAGDAAWAAGAAARAARAAGDAADAARAAWAAWSAWAAGDAAWAAGAAWAAVWSARAAGDIAGVTGDAEKKWQTERLLKYLYPKGASDEQF